MHTPSSKLFSYNKSTKTFASEASTVFGSDRIPSEFIMISEKTGADAAFFLTSTHVDGEGDVMFYRYLPHPRDHRLVGVVVNIYNT